MALQQVQRDHAVGFGQVERALQGTPRGSRTRLRAVWVVFAEVGEGRILRTEPEGDQQSATANGCTRLGRRLELVTHQCALRPRDLYVYLRLHRRQPITERAGPRAGERE